MNQSKKVLSVFSLVMINVIAVDSLRTLPISATLGLPLISYYVVAALAFFIPVALVAAELATAYPETGGLYVWVREAFGKRSAFISIWLQWIYNVVWYPTILAFIAATLAYLINPELTNNKYYLLITVLSSFWLFTFLNYFGMKISSIISIIGATLGTLFPMILIIALAFNWILLGQPTALDFSSSIIPNFSSLNNLSLFSVVLFGLIGIEMSAVHAEEVKNPQRDYPKALLYSTIIIISTLSLGSLSILIVVPQKTLSVVSGFIDAYAIFFDMYHIPWMTKVIALLIVLGCVGSVSTWIIGPTKGLLVAAKDGSLPARFARTNRFGAPTFILFTQAIIVSLLSSVFVLFDSVNEAYFVLSQLCAQMALLVYILMFAAALRLRYTQPNKPRAYTVPGGNKVMWLICTMGVLCCTTAMLIGFTPPSQILIQNVFGFECILVGGLILFVCIPWILSKKTIEKSKQ